jgi:molybdopterin-containing oxidoreductase family iron-sulfur binding subunit
MHSSEHPETAVAVPAAGAGFDLAAVREHLRAATGPESWRSLEELARTPESQAALRRELALMPRAEGYDRRTFLQLMGASLALAGLAGCTRQPLEKIVPYVKQPEEIIPGRPLYFATAMTMSGVAMGLLAESHMGRPTKLEGSPEHPGSLGATDRFAQASILGMYDPDRSQVCTHLLAISSWQAASEALQVALGEQRQNNGAGIRILTETVSSPSLAAQLRAFLAQHPRARWIQYEADGRDNVRDASRRAFGAPMSVRYDLSQADVIVALEADLLNSGPGQVRYARDFMRRRRHIPGREMNRLYVAESMPTGTGATADHRLAARPDRIAALAAGLAAAMGVPGVARPAILDDPKLERWLAAAAADLLRARGRGVVVAGDFLPPEAHVLVHAVNEALGNAGVTVLYADPIEAEPTLQGEDLAGLVSDMRAGRVDMLLVLGANPVYNAPADLDFAAAMGHVAHRFHLGLYQDETAELCHWHVPMAHYLESWGDARAYDGTVSLVQPLIEPLYDGKTAHDLLAALLGEPSMTGLDLLRRTWGGSAGAEGFETFWRRSLHDGVIAGSAFAPRGAMVSPGAAAEAAQSLETSAGGDGLELAVRLDAAVHDGRFANNGWLQEVPRPLTKIVWENAAILSPATAASLGVRTNDVVSLAVEGRKVEAPVWVLAGHADRCVTAHLGYGRRRAGRTGTGIGFDAFALRTVRQPGTRAPKCARRARPIPSSRRKSTVTWSGAIWCAAPRSKSSSTSRISRARWKKFPSAT